MKQFRMEVDVHNRLKHKNIISVLDYHVDFHGRLFFIMEFVKGRSLEAMIKSRGGIGDESLIHDIFVQLCDAVIYMHQMGILHKDLKPANVIVEENGDSIHIKVFDFGLAEETGRSLQSATKEKFIAGSPIYMSPEQCKGDNMDARSEVYSLGVLLYQLITGKVPYDEKSIYAMMEAHCNQIRKPDPIAYAHRNLAGAKMLDAIIGVTLDAEANNRFQSVECLRGAIDKWYECVQKDETDDLSVIFKFMSNDHWESVNEEADQTDDDLDLSPLPQGQDVGVSLRRRRTSAASSEISPELEGLLELQRRREPTQPAEPPQAEKPASEQNFSNKPPVVIESIRSPAVVIAVLILVLLVIAAVLKVFILK
ncbi:MAG: serine/threonine protein kinase, partial [Cyanobacteria bacterium]|nr:serine/threonine protein kinase [Cyanobacteriota bacterium]